MEENSVLQTETDVSSAATGLPETLRSAKSHMDVVIVVEEVVESDTTAKISSPSKNTASNEATMSAELNPTSQDGEPLKNEITTFENVPESEERRESTIKLEQFDGTSKNSCVSQELPNAEDIADSLSNGKINPNGNGTQDTILSNSSISSQISSQIDLNQKTSIDETIEEKISPDKIMTVSLDSVEKTNKPIKMILDRKKISSTDSTETKTTTTVSTVTPDQKPTNLDSTDKIKTENDDSNDKLSPPIKISSNSAKVMNVSSTENIKIPIKLSVERIKTEKIKTPIKLSPAGTNNVKLSSDRTKIVNIDLTKKTKTPEKLAPETTKTVNIDLTEEINSPKTVNIDLTEEINTPTSLSPDITKTVNIDLTEEINFPIKLSPDTTKTVNIDLTDEMTDEMTEKNETQTKLTSDITNTVDINFTEKMKSPIKLSANRTNIVNINFKDKQRTPIKLPPEGTKTVNVDLTQKIRPLKLFSVRNKNPNTESSQILKNPNQDSTEDINKLKIKSEEDIKTSPKGSVKNIFTSNEESLEKIKSPNEKTDEYIKMQNSENMHAKTSSIESIEKTKMKQPDERITKPNIENKEDKKEELSSKKVIHTPEKSSHSQTNLDISEKEHNRSISRELKSLIKSAKESKIISECTQLTTKTRKSRANLDSSSTNLNVSLESEKIQGVRRSSNNSQQSNTSEKSEKIPTKRSMRSQNPEFVFKVKKFLNSVTGKSQKSETDDETDDKKESESTSLSPKKKKNEYLMTGMSSGQNKLRSDSYCWRCHWLVEQTANDKGHSPLQCTVCPRSFHYKCLSGTERNKINSEKSWVCPECLSVLHAESSETRSAAMKKISLGDLCELLNHALERMMDLNGVEAFTHPVDRTAFPDYDVYVVHPMDLTLMKKNITEGLYGSTEAFLADAQWILHNSIIFNTLQSKLTSSARALMRSCRAEMGAIEACPQCYAAAHARRPTWFIDVCSTPHILLWAKLKGFPYWPAKGMSVSSSGLVDVRFFGAHDRAWVPARDCFLYSEKDPNNFRNKRQDILDSMQVKPVFVSPQEAEQHIRNISRKYGQFVYPAFKTQFEPTKLIEQLKMMIPTFEGEVLEFRRPLKDKPIDSPGSATKSRRSNSKSSKSSFNDGDTSENEEVQATQTPLRKMADGAEIAQEEVEVAEDKEKPMQVEVRNEEEEYTRKRRRSELEEAVITVMDSCSDEKRPKLQIEGKKNLVNISHQITDIEGAVIEVAKKIIEKPIDTINEKIITVETPVLLQVKKVFNNTIETENTPSKTSNKIKLTRSSTPKEKVDKSNTPKQKNVKPDITPGEKDKQGDKVKIRKRRNSRNVSLNNSQTAKDKKTNTTKNVSKNKDSESKTTNEKTNKARTDSKQSNKDKIQIDDDTNLALIARDVSNTDPGLPTISSVRSLSTTAPKETNKNKNTEVTVTADSDSSIFTPTSTDNVRNMKEAVNKLQKLRSDVDTTLVGKVGVRAFARMTSPEKEKPIESVEIEIKSEPMDFEDADRQSEKMDLMNAFCLRPVNPANLRNVRINKVVLSPVAKKTNTTKSPEIRIKAKKSFPQSRKVDDGRSELNSKNSMVYIPIQPPASQAPIRPSRPITVNGSNVQPVRPQISNSTSIVNTINTVTSPLVPLVTMPNVIPTPTISSNSLPNPICVPTVGQVPFITSVNGQWTFSLQPVMSVGAIDGTSSPPIVNGLPDNRNLVNNTVVPIATPNIQPTIVNTLGPSLQIQPNQITPTQPNSSTESTPGEIIPTVQEIERIRPIKLLVDGTGVNAVAVINNEMPAKLKNSKSSSTSCESIETDIPAPTRRYTKRIKSVISHTPPSPVSKELQNNNESSLGKPPRLQQRPPLLNPLDSNTPLGTVPAPSFVGPLTAKLNENAVKLTDFFKTLLEDSLDKIDEPASKVTSLKLQLEQMQWRHQQEVKELKHNHDLTISEMRASYEKALARGVNQARRTAQVELEAAVKAAKAKQWCANCNQEAQFYCCWNTSYCDYSCQKAHWSQHFNVCTQQRNQDNNSNESGIGLEKRLQPAPDNLPKNTPAPTLTVGGKVAARPFVQEAAQKPSIIVSMVEDKSGNQTVKCVGTYKPGTQQVQPMMINKQIINNDEPSKVVTSGGYLIVGAGNGNQPTVTSQRRPHTIQYYT